MRKIRGILLLVTTAFMMLTLAGCGKTTVKLDKYVTINAQGYDSMGTASYAFDYDAFKTDYAGKIKVVKDSEELRGLELLTGASPEELFLSCCVKPKLDKNSELSNGDVVTLTWNCDDIGAEEYFNVKLECSDIAYTVNGLEEVSVFNPFDYLTVSFSGIAPNGTVSITPDYNQPEMQYIQFSTDKNSGITIGDKITVSASAFGITESFVEMFGSVLSETEKVYTCDSLAYYVGDVEDIPDDMMNKMKAQAEDAFRAHVAQKWENPEDLNSISYAGNYFLTLKDGMYGVANNYLYLIYEIEATNPKPEQTIDYYYYVCFSNIIILEDGTCSVDLSNYTAPVASWGGKESFKVGLYYYSGYEELDSLFNNCVVSKIDNYQYTSTFK